MSEKIPMEIGPATLRMYQDTGVKFVILDVREPAEVINQPFDGDFIEIPINEIPESLDEIPREETVVVICAVGGRSMQVTGWLRQQGFDNITNLRGGIQAWFS